MAIDGASVTTVQDNNKPQSLDSGTSIKAPNRENELNKAGQTSEAGPAVVTDFSSAALETSRAPAETSQTADQNGTAASTDRSAAPPEPPPDRPQQRIDTIV